MGDEQVSLSYHQLINLFFFLFLCKTTWLHAQLCTQEQNSALLQLKGSFALNKSASWVCDYNGISSFPKTESWKNGSDCCSWDGVDCDRETGHVIGLDLSCSWLQGTIHPNSSLFLSFPHLQKLSLAVNDFAMSRISPEFTRLTELTHLNLSLCGFSGTVPLGVSFLNKLVSLDLSRNFGLRDEKDRFESILLSRNLWLRFKEGGFESLIQKLTKIRDLDLSFVNVSSSLVPNSMLNLTSLRTLHLYSTGLHGKFPSGIFHLPHVEELALGGNEALTGYLPDFMNLSYPLQGLDLSFTGFSGVLPVSVANLKSLKRLTVSWCKFQGSIPTSLWNLTQITHLRLRGNNFSGIIPSSISNFRNLGMLDLSRNNFSGIIPSSISNLSNLHSLFLNDNYFAGPFFSWGANLSKLLYLDVSNNFLTGPLPPQVIAPLNLISLSIGGNLINGTIPSWVFKLPVLESLSLSHNKLIGHTLEFQSTSLQFIDLSYNNLHGTIPNSTFELPNLTLLILSSNTFSGTIPESHRFSENLTVLELQRNNFSGIIHDSFKRENSLETINLNSNGFEGPVPKSLVHCRQLKVLDLGNNKFHDKFLHWLEHLPKLHILILRSNKFHGPMLTFKTKFPFPSLRVIDMSDNYLTGPLPEEYFRNFQAMVNVDERGLGLQYMASDRGVYYTLNMVIKGSFLEEKVLTYFIAIDLSRNQFEGNIPEIVGRLSSVRGLNLSHNSLKGHIPKSLGNLTKLEWLDLSSNKLSGEIPQQLTKLNFLSTLNLSQNRLTGPIPRGKQFDTFSNDSYINNLALCGPPLSNACGDPKATQPPPSTFGKEEDSEDGCGFCWEVILPGYGFGLVVGLVMGYLMFSFRKPEWLVKMVEGVGNKNGKRLKSKARRDGGRRN